MACVVAGRKRQKVPRSQNDDITRIMGRRADRLGSYCARSQAGSGAHLRHVLLVFLAAGPAQGALELAAIQIVDQKVHDGLADLTLVAIDELILLRGLLLATY